MTTDFFCDGNWNFHGISGNIEYQGQTNISEFLTGHLLVITGVLVIKGVLSRILIYLYGQDNGLNI